MYDSGRISLSAKREHLRRTKNITVAVSERTYYDARLYAAGRRMSISATVQFLLENLPLVTQAVRKLVSEDPNFGSEPAPRRF